ncbi:hypothetical protein FQA39_LY00290 [Lamprigera yunnana]|nr:hypothetical protein FQA39_LY00290 [Lamprigera yunnana]
MEETSNDDWIEKNCTFLYFMYREKLEEMLYLVEDVKKELLRFNEQLQKGFTSTQVEKSFKFFTEFINNFKKKFSLCNDKICSFQEMYPLHKKDEIEESLPNDSTKNVSGNNSNANVDNSSSNDIPTKSDNLFDVDTKKEINNNNSQHSTNGVEFIDDSDSIDSVFLRIKDKNDDNFETSESQTSSLDVNCMSKLEEENFLYIKKYRDNDFDEESQISFLVDCTGYEQNTSTRGEPTCHNEGNSSLYEIMNIDNLSMEVQLSAYSLNNENDKSLDSKCNYVNKVDNDFDDESQISFIFDFSGYEQNTNPTGKPICHNEGSSSLDEMKIENNLIMEVQLSPDSLKNENDKSSESKCNYVNKVDNDFDDKSQISFVFDFSGYEDNTNATGKSTWHNEGNSSLDEMKIENNLITEVQLSADSLKNENDQSSDSECNYVNKVDNDFDDDSQISFVFDSSGCEQNTNATDTVLDNNQICLKTKKLKIFKLLDLASKKDLINEEITEEDWKLIDSYLRCIEDAPDILTDIYLESPSKIEDLDEENVTELAKVETGLITNQVQSFSLDTNADLHGFTNEKYPITTLEDCKMIPCAVVLQNCSQLERLLNSKDKHLEVEPAPKKRRTDRTCSDKQNVSKRLIKEPKEINKTDNKLDWLWCSLTEKKTHLKNVNVDDLREDNILPQQLNKNVKLKIDCNGTAKIESKEKLANVDLCLVDNHHEVINCDSDSDIEFSFSSSILHQKYSRLQISYAALKSKYQTGKMELQSVNSEIKSMKDNVSVNYVTRNEYDDVVKQRDKLKYLCEKEFNNSSDDDDADEGVTCESINDLKHKYTLLCTKYKKLKAEKSNVVVLGAELGEALKENDKAKEMIDAYDNLKSEYAYLVKNYKDIIKNFYELQQKAVTIQIEVNALRSIKTNYLKLKAIYKNANEKYDNLKYQLMKKQNSLPESTHPVNKTESEKI